MTFADRRQAGRLLAERLQAFATEDVVVLGLPRGGVPVAFEVARVLHAPLDVIVVRKVGVPGQPELAMGAIGEDGVRVVNPEVVRLAGVSEAAFTAVEARERDELDRRATRFREHRPRVDLRGRTALVVDDGLATGSTARAACQVARAHGAARVVLAVPVAPEGAVDAFADDVDQVIVLESPRGFHAVGQFYDDFGQTSDDEVVDLLACASSSQRGRPDEPGDPLGPRSEDVAIDLGEVVLTGHLEIPGDPLGVVVFAHGSGSSSRSPRNRFVASVLNEARIGTLLFDLLTPDEEKDRTNVFDVDLLASRLTDATNWLCQRLGGANLPIGYFGASTGAAAALWAAGEQTVEIAAVVSRGGRPDLAGDRLEMVRAPTLLIVGGDDTVVLDLNRQAQRRLRAPSELTVIPGATHLFEEPGTLRAAAEAARGWFERHLATPG